MPDTLPPTAANAAPAAPAAPKPRPVPHPLPNPRHAGRVPPQIGADALNRIRNAAYQLPQVVAPGDMPSDLVPEIGRAHV